MVEESVGGSVEEEDNCCLKGGWLPGEEGSVVW